MRVVPVPQLLDNYAYLVIDTARRVAAVLDAAERESVELVAILSTHHHFDHVGGNDDLIAALRPRRMQVFGYAGDRSRIPGITDALDDGQQFEVGGLHGQALFIPAHTRGHLAYWLSADKSVFTGDTLFAGGCGRLFEGDAAQMMSSLAKLARLPDDTRVYCGHEYTEKNLEFAAELEPSNRPLSEKLATVQALRRQGTPTVPSTIAEEKATNPFLRTDSQELA